MHRPNAMNWTAVLPCIFLVFFGISFASGEEVSLRILHVNDFHGFAEPYAPLGSQQMLGGIAYLASKANDLREGKHALLLSAGDMIQGSMWTNLFTGAPVIELMNAMRFDGMAVGNHEFDFGKDELQRRISEAAFPVLGANVRGLEMLKPFIIREVGGVRIALIGVVTEDTPLTTHPENVAGLEFNPPAEAVNRYVKELEQKADIIVVLSHIGHSADRLLAEKVGGIDVIVGGHSHTRIERPVTVGGTVIVQAWEHGKALGVLDLTVKDGKIVKYEGRLEDIRPEKGKEDKSVLSIVKKYEEKVDSALNETVGETRVDLDGENVRRKETNLGNLVADVMRQVSGADAAIVNGGAIRTSIRKGNVKVKDVYSALPFNDYIVAVRLTGKQITEALEHGVSAVEEESGRFPQVSGLSFTYNPAKEKGARVKEVLIAGQPLVADKEYIVATNGFLAAGGDGYRVFAEAIGASGDFSAAGGTLRGERLVYSDSSRWLKDILARYVSTRKTVEPQVEGRIKEIR